MPNRQYLLRRAALAERAAEALSAFPEFQERLLDQARDWRRQADASPEAPGGMTSELPQADGVNVPQGVTNCVAACAVLLSSVGAL